MPFGTTNLRHAVAAGAALASLAVATATPAMADEPTQPQCTAADYAGITAGVATAMSAYLFTHPDVNDYITELEAADRGQSAQALVDYEMAHPTVRDDLAGIRRPIVDFNERCGHQSNGSLV